MKKIHILLVIIAFLLKSCASQLPPTGGPVDEEPPILIYASPENKTLNFHGQVVELTFDEDIQVKNLEKELLITPTYLGEIDYKEQQESVLIEFYEPFADSTTYVLNFRGAIVDLHEGNPAVDLRIAFSTWDFLDSLEMHGNITDILTGNPAGDYTIGIYKAADTLNPLNGIPLYTTKSREDGSYSLYNIKSDKYRIYAFDDKNNNLLIDYKKESYGFLKDTINLDTIKSNLDLLTTNLDLTDLAISGKRQNGHHYEIKLSKYATSYNLSFLDSTNTDTLYHRLTDANRTIMVFNTLHSPDSTGLLVSIIDSLYTSITDTVYIQFIPSSRKKEEFKITSVPTIENGIMQTAISFSKPIKSFQPDSVFIEWDTVNIFPIDTSMLITKEDFKITFKKNFTYDTLYKSEIIISLPDSIKNDSSFTKPKKIIREPKMNFNYASFISIEDDSSAYISMSFTEVNANQFGSIKGEVNLPYKSYILQLIDKNHTVIDTLVSPKSYSFQKLNPGDYRMRILIDEDKNGRWDPGNIVLNKNPEPILFYEDENGQQVISLRANWELVDISIELRPEL